MGINYNPTVVTDGLVFCYDMANTQKSWKGAPATNYINTTPTWGGDGPDQTQFVKGYTEITDPNLMYRGLKTFLWSPGTSLNCYLQSDDIVGGTSTTSTVWTFSCYVRAETRHTITSMGVYMYYPTSDGNELGTIEDVGNGWYRISRTRTGTNSYISLIGFTGFNANVRYYLSGAMLTKDNIAVAPLNGNETRSNTQAILDMVGGNAITANSLTYDSDNTFSFNGSNNSIITPSIISGSSYSIEAWVKLNLLTGEQRFISVSGTGTFTVRLASSELNFHYNPFDASPPSTQTSATGITYSANVYYHVIATNSSTNGARFYVNGALKGTGERAVDFPSGNIRIGSDATQTLFTNGTIPVVKVYSKELSAFEVLQNFNALRGRYGI